MSDAREAVIETAWEQRAGLNPRNAIAEVRQAVDSVIADLDSGSLRVASRIEGAGQSEWTGSSVDQEGRVAVVQIGGQPADVRR